MPVKSHGYYKKSVMKKLHSTHNLGINGNEPLMMHIDMNSSFATIEQQANPLLRGRPIAVSPYTSPGGIVIAPSIEAKQHGIKLGCTNQEAKLICPDIVILPPDPAKYRDAHIRFKRIFTSYTDKVVPKSIDEAVIDFRGSQIIKRRTMEEIALEIKQRVKEDLGCWVRVNCGIATNSFIAKLAAGFDKPDGLTVINKDNLLDVYRKIQLVDLPGINFRNEIRLNNAEIFSPLQFIDAPVDILRHRVFQAITGVHWYFRLRGWEVDDVVHSRKTIGHTYALGDKTADKKKLAKLLMKLSVKLGRRMRSMEYHAGGINVSFVYTDRSHWHRSMKLHSHVYTDQDIFRNALRVMNMQPKQKRVSNLAVTVYNLEPFFPEQSSLFDGTRSDPTATAKATDIINDRYGNFVITPALMMNMKGIIEDRIAFGGVKDLQDLY